MPRPLIVYVTPRPPYPPTSGAVIRQFQLLRAYNRVGRVHLVTLGSDDDRSAARPLEGHCEGIHIISTQTAAAEAIRHAHRVRRIAGWVRGYRPGAVKWSYSAELERVLEDLAGDADVVHVARLAMTCHTERLVRRRRKPRMVLDLDDVESSAKFRELRYGPREQLAHRLFGYYDLARLWAYEATMVRRFDRVFVCSERDRRRFGLSNVVVVPNGAHVPPVPPERRTDGLTLLFCGQLSYGPNADAVRFLVTSVFPEIRQALPDTRLLIVGRGPAPDIMALHDGKSIVVANDVPSVTDYYAAATIAVVPLRFGGGTRLKILEAWAHGVPIVSTTVGCEGLDGLDGQHLMVADRSRDFASRCVALLRSPELRDRIAREGRRLVAERYRWEDIGTRAVAEVALSLPGYADADQVDHVQSTAAGSNDGERH